MARADLLANLVKHGTSGDGARFRKVVEAIIAEERAKQHTVLASQLENILNASNEKQASLFERNTVTLSRGAVDNLLMEILPRKKIKDLFFPNEIINTCNDFAREHHRSELLRSYGVEPRNRVLLIGPPGNGKTSLAEALAESLMLPMYTVRYEGVVGAYLGETAIRLKKLIEFVSSRKCVLFFDEFETLGKERGDLHETGEIKRVVSSLLLQIDSLPSHVVVIAATNHPELLDRAVWRRFQIRMNLPEPSLIAIESWLHSFQNRIKIPFGVTAKSLSEKLVGTNFAEIEEFGNTILRDYILSQPEACMKKIIKKALKLWESRAKKA